MITGAQITERPQLPVPPAITWLATMPPSMAGLFRPFAQYDWPLPIPQSRFDQSWYQNINLLPKPPPPDTTHILRPIWRSLPDQPVQPLLQQSPFPNLVINTAVVQPPFKQTDWPVPFAPQLATVSWTWSYNLNLVGKDRLPNRQSDWPIPTPPYRIDQFWTFSYNLNLIGQDQLPKGVQVSELPPRDFARQFQTWINVTSLALTTAAPNLFAQARQQDWPVPRGPEPDPRRSWEWWYNLNLIGQDALPNRQTDWPLTPAQSRSADLATWINRVQFQLLKPFAQIDWPNPTAPFRDPTLATVARGYNLDLLGQDQLPNRQTDWPNPTAPDPLALLRAFVLPLNLNLIPSAILAPPLFMRNQDWPLPVAPIHPNNLRTWPTQGSPAPIIPGVPPPPVTGPAVYNKMFLAGPGYLNVIPGEKPS
jgi:hypothetical protein